MKLKSFDGHSINDHTNYFAFFEDGVWGLDYGPVMVKRQGYPPILGTVERPSKALYVHIMILDDSSQDSLYTQLCQWFDADDEEAKALVVEDDGGGNDRYVYGVCRQLKRVPGRKGAEYVATVVVDGDVRWRAVAASTEAWSLTASGQTRETTNEGDDEAYPVITIEPTSGKSGSYLYKVWTPVRWRVDGSATSYPFDIGNDSFDTDALVTASKMQADGDDLRVKVDGEEVDRWLDGIDTVSTKVWINLDFAAKQEVTLATAIASSGSISTIDAVEDISGFPSAGILVIDSEAFVYTGKNNSTKKFSGITRAAKGTSMAAHTTTDTVWWVQHDIWIIYGNAAASAPSVDDDYKPVFNLATSTNVSWDYDEFGEDDGLRTGAWVQQVIETSPTFYTANRVTDADPWEEIGIGIEVSAPGTLYKGGWMAHNPCGITVANFQNGEKYSDELISFNAKIYSSEDNSSWTWEYTVPTPGSVSTWESWSQNETLSSGALYVRMIMEQYGYPDQLVEAADVTLTLDSGNTPVVTMGAEQTNYSLELTITNNTTGESISLDYSMALNEELEVDTDEKTVIDLEDDSKQYQALTVIGGARRDWLALVPGDNELQFDETGLAGMDVGLSYEERTYG